ncbi:MAG: S49 family peptidase, partial [Alphaproteobacteria bacterium]|nr:S49 family peptidase [Alphaproteobacteria bacterium]
MKNTNAVSIRDGIAVIRVSGPLFRYANLFTKICGATSYELLAQDFNKALQDINIKGILLDVDSPGGEVNGCSEIADMIFNARGKKPIMTYASGYCCSGAYWIASACDKILASDTAILGSIGVVSIFEKDDENKTIEIVSSQSPNKRPNINTDEGRAKIQARIDELAEVFIDK